jgi:hypothetical protein
MNSYRQRYEPAVVYFKYILCYLSHVIRLNDHLLKVHAEKLIMPAYRYEIAE